MPAPPHIFPDDRKDKEAERNDARQVNPNLLLAGKIRKHNRGLIGRRQPERNPNVKNSLSLVRFQNRKKRGPI